MPRVEFESAYNLLVAIALIESEKTVLEQILTSLISEPTQKTGLKFKVYVKAPWTFSGSTLCHGTFNSFISFARSSCTDVFVLCLSMIL